MELIPKEEPPQTAGGFGSRSSFLQAEGCAEPILAPHIPGAGALLICVKLTIFVAGVSVDHRVTGTTPHEEAIGAISVGDVSRKAIIVRTVDMEALKLVLISGIAAKQILIGRLRDNEPILVPVRHI
jgi:hypothetical protein